MIRETIKDAQFDNPAQLREVSSLTITIDSAKIQELKREICEFRKSLFSGYGEAMPQDDCVYQVNLQMFPLTQIKKPT